ncbi:MAG: SpoIIE family protein phosphatase [Flavobacteriales bacterium]|nr:SpoIIE family protein phosphatase [Flavobacteriales bacterium]
MIVGIEEEVYSIEEMEGVLWLGTKNGVIRLLVERRNGRITFSEKMFYKESDGLPNGRIGVRSILGKLKFFSGKGLHRFDYIRGNFFPDTTFGIAYANGIKGVHRIIDDNEENVWMSTTGEEFDLGYMKNILKESYIWVNKPFMAISEELVRDIYSDENGLTWFAGSEGVFRYDPSLRKASSEKFSIFIRKVLTTQDSVLFGGSFYKENRIHTTYDQPAYMIPDLTYANNSIRIMFSAHSSKGEQKNRYSYRLEGFNDEWSDWKTDVMANYTNLHEGSYLFQVKAINLVGNESSTASYRFQIAAPWYRTIGAYVGYIILFIGLLYAAVRISLSRLQAAKKRLEKIVKERTKELVLKNEDLARAEEEIRMKNEDITDSINYAKNIQQAILPLADDFTEMLPNHFILFEPKDIVSGDFYWASNKNDIAYYCVADCTGHGVPGAFMSMICSSLLSEVVNSKEVDEPADIFYEVRKALISHLQQTGEGQKDGMDAIICALYKKKGQQSLLSCACANNPLFIIRKSSSKPLKVTSTLREKIVKSDYQPAIEVNGLSLYEIRPDKQPVGILFGDQVPFTNYVIEMEPEDMIYAITDGYQDQFGGPMGKKFMIKKLKNLFIEICTLDLEAQHQKLFITLNEWMNVSVQNEVNEQVDDVLIIGVRV